jgi:hypothetical protein
MKGPSCTEIESISRACDTLFNSLTNCFLEVRYESIHFMVCISHPYFINLFFSFLWLTVSKAFRRSTEIIKHFILELSASVTVLIMLRIASVVVCYLKFQKIRFFQQIEFQVFFQSLHYLKTIET